MDGMMRNKDHHASADGHMSSTHSIHPSSRFRLFIRVFLVALCFYTSAWYTLTLTMKQHQTENEARATLRIPHSALVLSSQAAAKQYLGGNATAEEMELDWVAWSRSRSCDPPSSAKYGAWLAAHARLVSSCQRGAAATSDSRCCASIWHQHVDGSVIGPRALIGTWGDPSVGFGDRLSKAAGMFLFALISQRPFFMQTRQVTVTGGTEAELESEGEGANDGDSSNMTSSTSSAGGGGGLDLSRWFAPRHFDWRYSGAVERCFGSHIQLTSDGGARFKQCHEGEGEKDGNESHADDMQSHLSLSAPSLSRPSHGFSFSSPSPFHTDLKEIDWGGEGTYDIYGTIRRTFWPRRSDAAKTFFPNPLLIMQGQTNTVRSYTIYKEFKASCLSSSSASPRLVASDDGRSSILSGCLLRLLWRPTPQLHALVQRPLARAQEMARTYSTNKEEYCLVALHVRFGDKFMFHFSNGNGNGKGGRKRNMTTNGDGDDDDDAESNDDPIPLQDDATDMRIQPSSHAVIQPMRCTLQQAVKRCTDASTPVAVYIATDTPTAIPWLEQAAATLGPSLGFSLVAHENNNDRTATHRSSPFRAPSSSSPSLSPFRPLTLLRSDLGPPGHVAAFGRASSAHALTAEQQLMADFYMMTRARAVITTGSTLSFMAASMADTMPINANTCKHDD